MRVISSKQFAKRYRFIIGLVAIVCLGAFRPASIRADQASDLRGKLGSTSDQINGLKTQADGAADHAATLAGQLAIMQAQAAMTPGGLEQIEVIDVRYPAPQVEPG